MTSYSCSCQNVSRPGLVEAVLPLLRRRSPAFNASRVLLCAAYLRRYGAGGRKFLPYHTDQGTVTVNIRLSSPAGDNAGPGGRGSRFDGDSDFVDMPLTPKRAAGEALIHHASLRHAVDIEGGTRASACVVLVLNFAYGRRCFHSDFARFVSDAPAPGEGARYAVAPGLVPDEEDDE